jgi:eukaryotic translation initiation factor 2C
MARYTTVKYRAEEEDEPSANAKTYQLRLQYTGPFRVSELVDYLTSTRAGSLFKSKDEIIQALNIIVGHYPKTDPNIFSVGANKHFELAPASSETMSLGAGLHAIRGFFISVRAATSRILVNVQVKHAACYNQGPLSRSMSAYLEQNNQSMVKLKNFLKRVRVQVTHIVRKNRMGLDIPRVKAIEGLAAPGDGQGLQHPPVVPKFGAGAEQVKFFLGDAGEQPLTTSGSKKGKKHGKAGPEPPQPGYISVRDFFRRSECLPDL